MFRVIAVKEGSKVANSKSEVGVGSNSQIVEAANEFMIWHMLCPQKGGQVNGDGLVWVAKHKTGCHRCVARVCHHLIEFHKEPINEGSLLDGDSALRKAQGDGNAKGEVGRAKV